MGSNFLTDIGQRVSSRRKDKCLTQQELAEIADLSNQVISNTETGQTAIRPENLVKLSKALEVSSDYILTGSIIDKDVDLILNKINKLNEQQTIDLFAIIDLFVKNCI